MHIQVITNAQSITPYVISSGEITNTVNGYSVSSTIGQLITPTATNGNYTITQGFQQPSYDVNTFIQNIIYSPIEVKASPNPFTTYLTVESIQTPITEIRLFDALGRISFQEKYQQNTTQIINTDHIPNGSYILEVIGSTQIQRTYIKLIKQ